MLKISHHTGGIAQTNGFLLESEKGCIVVDAPSGMCAWLQKRVAKPSALLLTHQHFDHVEDAAAIAAAFECPIYAFADYSQDLTLEKLFSAGSGMTISVPPFTVTHKLADDAGVDLVGLHFRVLHVPGHSPDSIAFYCAEEATLLGGDILFRDGVGRTDLPEGGWQMLLSGIAAKLLTLPDETRVHPGHGPSTDIRRERSRNPFLQDL
jgi:hydroxyacylglutathione hydrolase